MAKIMKTYQSKAAGEPLRLVLDCNQRSLPQWCGVLGFAAKFPAPRTSLEI